MLHNLRVSPTARRLKIKAFKVTALIDGKLDSWVAYGNSVGHVKKFITDGFNKELQFDTKVIGVVPEKESVDKK